MVSKAVSRGKEGCGMSRGGEVMVKLFTSDYVSNYDKEQGILFAFGEELESGTDKEVYAVSYAASTIYSCYRINRKRRESHCPRRKRSRSCW